MTIQQDAIELQKEVFLQNYYLHLYEGALRQEKLTAEGIDAGEYTDKQIVDMANSFWFALPDSPSIRRQPFWQLCNIAEHDYRDEEEWDED